MLSALVRRHAFEAIFFSDPSTSDPAITIRRPCSAVHETASAGAGGQLLSFDPYFPNSAAAPKLYYGIGPDFVLNEDPDNPAMDYEATEIARSADDLPPLGAGTVLEVVMESTGQGQGVNALLLDIAVLKNVFTAPAAGAATTFKVPMRTNALTGPGSFARFYFEVPPDMAFSSLNFEFGRVDGCRVFVAAAVFPPAA